MTAALYERLGQTYQEARRADPRIADLFAPVSDLLAMLPGATTRPVMIPEDCHDGFVQAFWKRPHALLDPEVRSSMALFGRMQSEDVDDRIQRLRADLEDGTWKERNQALLGASSVDLAHRLVVWTRPA